MPHFEASTDEFPKNVGASTLCFQSSTQEKPYLM
jgi:hypothetical protein